MCKERSLLQEVLGSGLLYTALIKKIEEQLSQPEQPTECIIHKFTMLLEGLIANDGEELKYLKAFDFETYSKLKKEFGDTTGDHNV